MGVFLNEVDKVEILTLQDNYIDIVVKDNNSVILRAMPLDMKNSILAEHGFSSIVTVTKNNRSRSMLFDFGYSAFGAAYNADALGADLTAVEVAALSHGHLDHVGGLAELVQKVGKSNLELVVHPEVFRYPRYFKAEEGSKIELPGFHRETVKKAGMHLIETEKPLALLDGDVLFLGGIPRLTDFEKGSQRMLFQKDGEEKWDDVADDTSIVMNVSGKGLIVLSGCAHSGIINTVEYAKKVTHINDILAVMGGFHLTGPDMKPAIGPTIRHLKKLNPTFVIPTHCTGRNAVMQIEKEMSDNFILNMVGTKMTFSRQP